MAADFFRDNFNDATATNITTRAPAVGGSAPTIDIGGGVNTTGAGGSPIANAAYFGSDSIRKAIYSIASPPSSGTFQLENICKAGSAGNWRVDATVAQTAGASVTVLLHNDGTVSVSASTGGSGSTSQGGFGSNSDFAWGLYFTPTTCTLKMAANVAGLASATITASCALTGAITPNSVQVGGRDVYYDDAGGINPAGGGTPPGIASETDAALALSSKQIRALGLATETDTALALTSAAGLPFNSAPYEFGQRTGLDVADFSVYASTALNVSVYAATDVLLTTQLFAYTESTGSDGRLTRKTHASLVAGTTYIFVAVTAGGALVAAGRIQAT